MAKTNITYVGGKKKRDQKRGSTHRLWVFIFIVL